MKFSIEILDSVYLLNIFFQVHRFWFSFYWHKHPIRALYLGIGRLPIRIKDPKVYAQYTYHGEITFHKYIHL